MRRRDFLKYIGTGFIGLSLAPTVFAEAVNRSSIPSVAISGEDLDPYLTKMRHFNSPHADDVYLEKDRAPVLGSTLKRLQRLQRTVGFSRFYLLDFDEAITLARDCSPIGAFSPNELDFMEMIFYEDGSRYGFLGDKPIKHLTAGINKKDVEEIPKTGNYVFKGPALTLYRQIQKDVGHQLVLTSGVRGLMKQFVLFLKKAEENQGNLSLASRSLAPPGYSYHGIGDFDVGQAGFGPANFTDRFASTPVFQRLMELGYVNLRYQLDNPLGVRFEPWHIKVNEA
jgi:hypothetical protein